MLSRSSQPGLLELRRGTASGALDLNNVDFSLVKDTAIRRLGEAGKLEFRAETFDLFNHPNFSGPASNCNHWFMHRCEQSPDPNPASRLSDKRVGSGAGRITEHNGNSGALPGGDRQIQFGLKLIF